MSPILSIDQVSKTYEGGHQALSHVSLNIEQGEILALLGPNGAGKTTLISLICGLVKASSGTVLVGGHHIERDYRAARKLIGLVPQELTLESFESVFNTVSYSRGLFGLKPNPDFIENLLKRLSLWDKKDAAIRQLSGGMKRRVLIAKALSHEPRILFLDEPTAGVDVALRKDMWDIVAGLRKEGVTIILTTHYIEEAEAIADRIGIISGGELLLAEAKSSLMQRFGKKILRVDLRETLSELPQALKDLGVTLDQDGLRLNFRYDSLKERTGVRSFLGLVADLGISILDVGTHESSLEEIFVDLVSAKGANS